MDKISLRGVFIVICALVLIHHQARSQSSESSESTDQWWEYGHFYQVYPRSFQDSDGDGIGDLNGITERLPHLKDIGVTGVLLSPMFQSPQTDFGYDISDFREVDPIYGTMDDFDRMLQRCEELNIKLILDFVPNHSSDKHIWFQKSSNPNDPEFARYKDYYVWSDGITAENGTKVPPSNWPGNFGGSAWQYVESRNQFYLHQFGVEQPDLNFRNPVVNEEMKEVLRFWLRKGIDGVRIDAVPFLFEAPENPDGTYPNEKPSGDCPDTPDLYCFYDHTQTFDRPETFGQTYEWRAVLEESQFSNKKIRISMTEAYSTLENTIIYYGRTNDNGEIIQDGAQIPFNFQLIDTDLSSNAYDFRDLIQPYLDRLPNGRYIQPNWVLGNHDRKRISTRYSPEKTDLINIFLKTMPGITVTYYGEEIGMTDEFLSFEDTLDPLACGTNPQIYTEYSRDPSRTPMQWDETFQAGFSTAQKTWLPVAANYTLVNVALQTQARRSYSHLQVFKKLISLRKNPTMKYGGFQMAAPNQNILVYKRQMKRRSKHKKSASDGNDIFVIVLNFGSSSEFVDLKSIFGPFVPKKMKVVVASIQSTCPVEGDVLNTSQIVIEPAVGLVLMGVC